MFYEDDYYDGDDRLEFADPGGRSALRAAGIRHVVVKGDETEEEITRLEKRGITCVRVETDEPKPEEVPLANDTETDE